jgi:hypothetical protein
MRDIASMGILDPEAGRTKVYDARMRAVEQSEKKKTYRISLLYYGYKREKT